MEIPILARSNTPSFSIEIDGTFTEGLSINIVTNDSGTCKV